jgi:hypothetical protein
VLALKRIDESSSENPDQDQIVDTPETINENSETKNNEGDTNES